MVYDNIRRDDPGHIPDFNGTGHRAEGRPSYRRRHGTPAADCSVVSIIGNMVPVPFIIIFIRRILDWMHRFEKFDRIATKMEEKAAKGGEKLVKYEMFGLFLLVAIPLPGTGAWTGSLVAAFFDLRLRNAVPVIFAGVVAAGIVVFLITYGVVAVA